MHSLSSALKVKLNVLKWPKPEAAHGKAKDAESTSEPRAASESIASSFTSFEHGQQLANITEHVETDSENSSKPDSQAPPAKQGVEPASSADTPQTKPSTDGKAY